MIADDVSSSLAQSIYFHVIPISSGGEPSGAGENDACPNEDHRRDVRDFG